MNLGLGYYSFDTVQANAMASFMQLWSYCNNHIITYLQQLIFRHIFDVFSSCISVALFCLYVRVSCVYAVIWAIPLL